MAFVQGIFRASRALVAVAALTFAASAVPAANDVGAPAPPMLMGETSREAILDIAPDWRHEYDSYTPAADDVAVLRQAPKGATLNVYFGSWCSDSRVGVPHLLTALDAAGRRHLKARYYAVDRTKKEPADLLAGVGVERVPTIVLLVNGREVGRIVETPQTTIEHDLALLVRETLGTSRTP